MHPVLLLSSTEELVTQSTIDNDKALKMIALSAVFEERILTLYFPEYCLVIITKEREGESHNPKKTPTWAIKKGLESKR